MVVSLQQGRKKASVEVRTKNRGLSPIVLHHTGSHPLQSNLIR